MLSILEIPSIRRQAKPIDLRTYHWMGEQGLVEEKTELLRGVIVEKMSIYSEAGIPETWLVLPESERIELFSVPQAGRYTAHTLCGLDDIARSTQFPQFQVALADLLADRAV